MVGTNGLHVSFTGAKIALFAGDRRVTEWEQLNRDGSSPTMWVGENVVDPWFRIYSVADVLLYSAPVRSGGGLMNVGDSIAFPGLDLVSIDESYLS